VDHWYGRLVPEARLRVAGEPAADGGASVFFLASCVLNQLSSPVNATPLGQIYPRRSSSALPLFAQKAIDGVTRRIASIYGYPVLLGSERSHWI
jgi:hypothetical protein